VATLSGARWVVLCVLLAGAGHVPPVAAAAPTEQQVKAVFVFNFSHFVQWPPATSATPDRPFLICLLGGEEMADHLEQAIAGEQVGGRALQIRHSRGPEDIADCQILFIGRTAEPQLERIVAANAQRGTLTVSDLEDAARRGVMIQLANERNRVRLVINIDRAQAAGLTISSNLLRPAEIVGARN
jgi:hypothetical protein